MNKLVKMLILFLTLLPVFEAGAVLNYRTRELEGYNWYSEKKEMQEKGMHDEKVQASQKQPALPEYERNIRALQEAHQKAHRRALDNPTRENILAELYIEKEMMRKSQIYGERRVAIAMLDSAFTDMDHHSNVLHRSVQEEVENKEMSAKLTKLAKDWGLVVQVQKDCAHCHAFAPIVKKFANEYGFQLLAASASGEDFENIEGVGDSGQMRMFNPEGKTPILYLVKGDGKQVFPISRGINSAYNIIHNIVMIDKNIGSLF